MRKAARMGVEDNQRPTVWVRFFRFIWLCFYIFPSLSWSQSVVLNVQEGTVSVTKSKDGGQLIVESDGSSSWSFSTIPLHGARQNPKSEPCDALYSVQEAGGKLLGTVTQISDSVYLTARHVLAGHFPLTISKTPLTQKHSQSEETPFYQPEVFVFEKFKTIYQLVPRASNEQPLDLLVIAEKEDISSEEIDKIIRRRLSKSVDVGGEWSSCQYGVESDKEPYRQYSEGVIKRISGDELYAFLGISEKPSAQPSDLTTFGSSGASVWVSTNSGGSLVGVVSCLQTYWPHDHPDRGGPSFFPKVTNLGAALKSDKFKWKKVTLEELRSSPQARDPECPFTDGKSAGGFMGDERSSSFDGGEDSGRGWEGTRWRDPWTD